MRNLLNILLNILEDILWIFFVLFIGVGLILVFVLLHILVL